MASPAFAAPYVETAPTLPGGGVAPQYVTPTPPVDPHDPQQPTKLVKGAPASAFGGTVTPLGVQDRYTFANPRGPISLLRNTSAGYVLGSAFNGGTFDVVNKGSGTWYRGTIYGNYNNCGFTLAANINPGSGTPHSTCPTDWQADPSTFGSAFNCSGCGTGMKVSLTGAVNNFANVSPLTNANNPADNQRQLPGGTCVEWRYVTTNNQFVMARTSVADDDHGSWVFMEKTSFPNPLPTGSAQC
ncbi:hypothetical protein DSM104299_05277 [Baekduia alba]|nr:hypothetical protein DSM104299_05277 [Baekduia alba]